MKPKFISVLELAIDNGIELGYNRAHKHSDNLEPDMIKMKISEAIWEELYEWFDFPGDNSDES